MATYDPLNIYNHLRDVLKNINEKIEDLYFIKNSLVIFHKKQFEKEIKELNSILKDIETKPIKEFNSQENRDKIAELEKRKNISEDVNKVKDFLLFKKIFEIGKGKDQGQRFDNASNELRDIKNSFKESKNIEIIFNKFKKIFKDIKEELSKKEESKSDEFIEQMIVYFDIKNKETKEDLEIMIKSKIYEKVVRSIQYFFDEIILKEHSFFKAKRKNPKLLELSEMNLESLKETLKSLKGNNIYDYKSQKFFYKIFTSFNDKKEALDFLKRKIDEGIDNLNYLIKKLDPTIKSISVKNIKDASDCLFHFEKLIKLDVSKIMEKLDEFDEDTIKKFVSYSKHYPSIIELDRKDGRDIFEEVYIMIDDASLTFKMDNEYFRYTKGSEKITKDINELIDLKNKINIQSENKEKSEEAKEEKDEYQIKCDKLRFFKKIISEFESIYEKIKILRLKGYNIPIIINISIKYPEITYKFNDEDNREIDFDDIKDYLFRIKNDYEKQLETIYQNEKHLRFIFGKMFRKIKLHQEGNCEILEIIRYILNKVDYKDKIIDGDPSNNQIGEDYEIHYADYTKTIFECMSKYIISLFQKNKLNGQPLNYQRHYENMLIKGEKKYKGIYIYKCGENLSMEEYILNLFQKRLEKLPIAQNILVCSNETSIEEIQSFLYRAILCDFNTLFIIEIFESFSNFQHNKMYSYIDKLLTYKYENYEDKKNINKLSTRDYLNSSIYFVYNNKLDNEIEEALLDELNKYTIQSKAKKEGFIEGNENADKNENPIGDLDVSEITNDNINLSIEKIFPEFIKVFSSDVCGLGKSFKIRKIIKEKNEIYFHFPLGGLLTKKIIYEKLSGLLQNIKNKLKNKKDEENKNNKNDKKDDEEEEEEKNEEYLEYNNVAVHLDLIESEETSLINEFLFSFLITKFYINNEDIIYIPNNMKIYVEIPNSFENYLTKYGILKVFEIDNIEIGKLPKLKLDEEIKKEFKRMIGKGEDEEIQQFIKDNIGISEYSYHQVNTFINLFISQFRTVDSELKFEDSQGKDVTQECITFFAKSTKFFTNGGFAKLIMNNQKQIKDKIDLCLDAYQNDLGKVEFHKTPLIYIDKATNKFRFEILPDISEEEKEDAKPKQIVNLVDIAYLIDGTGSMGYEINAATKHVIRIFQDLKKTYKDYDFRFGSVFYRDKIDSPGDKDEYFPLTNNMEDLKNKISKIEPYGGGDIPEDWVGGYDLALNKMEWRNGIKLIIHIADAGAHGREFSSRDRHPEQGALLPPLIKKCAENNINIIGFKIFDPRRQKEDYSKQSFEKISEIYNNYKISNKDN